eukprot:TRINITY_DN67634_c0_g1_i2.p1 TRINITY_DN67634_c0_g1~~TRINITY_DN67634_c0_g1_i2.p1  ORF type:complete len:196 (-),score=56.71 TRINITY_DN67634_c0_g1_i2:243-830(-)
MEEAIKKCPDVEFDVQWLPFQLNPDASDTPASKIEAYGRKFGKSPDEVMQMGAWMGQKFKDAGLPYNFTEKGTVANTWNAHRVLTAAYQQGGAAAQDKAAEVLFNAYFADELPPNDPTTLEQAARAAGVDGKALLQDEKAFDQQTKEELQIGKRNRVSGVPHFFVRKDGSSDRPLEISGAQPSSEFERAFKTAAR